MLDIDHFKRYNDVHSHDAGDIVLSTLGRFLSEKVRGGDTPCRYGGEEFTVIMPGASSEIALRKAKQLCDEVKQMKVYYRGQPLQSVTLSLGVASFPAHGLGGEALLRAADQALYQAKEAGRDRVVGAELPAARERAAASRPRRPWGRSTSRSEPRIGPSRVEPVSGRPESSESSIPNPHGRRRNLIGPETPACLSYPLRSLGRGPCGHGKACREAHPARGRSHRCRGDRGARGRALRERERREPTRQRGYPRAGPPASRTAVPFMRTSA